MIGTDPYIVVNCGQRYIDRGDPAVADFSYALGDFTLDAAWHDLDLSSIVPPAGANHLVCFAVRTAGAEPPPTVPIMFRDKNKVNLQNVAKHTNANGGNNDDWESYVMLNADRIIEYNIPAEPLFTAVTFTVRGYWVG